MFEKSVLKVISKITIVLSCMFKIKTLEKRDCITYSMVKQNNLNVVELGESKNPVHEESVQNVFDLQYFKLRSIHAVPIIRVTKNSYIPELAL